MNTYDEKGGRWLAADGDLAGVDSPYLQNMPVPDVNHYLMAGTFKRMLLRG